MNMKKICADCKIEKTHIFKKKYVFKKLYVDEHGRSWVSAACPDCANKRVKKAQAKRKIKEAI
jgi:hypothetical protein